MQRSEPPPLKAVSGKEIRDLHTAILGGDECNLLCAAVSKVVEGLDQASAEKKPVVLYCRRRRVAYNEWREMLPGQLA